MAPEAASPATTRGTEGPIPEFIRRIYDDYKSKIAHVFILHGNISDFPDNSGQRKDIQRTISDTMDENREKDMNPGRVQDSKSPQIAHKILAYFNLSSGLEFAHPASKNMWMDAMKAGYGDEISKWPANWHEPRSIDACLEILNRWFKHSKKLQQENKSNLENARQPKPELLLTVLFTDSDALFPEGQISQLIADRTPIVHVRNWARDKRLGDRNRIIIICRHLAEIHESLRGGGSGISTVLIPKPSLEDRETWLKNFSATIEAKTQAQNRPLIIGANEAWKVELAPGFDQRQFAVQSAGMSRRQIEDVIMRSWLMNTPVDFTLVRSRKQRALEDEYEGIVDFFEPEFGFERIGGHEHLKKYFQRKVIAPLQQGDRRLCSRGVLLTGPPGTGKTLIAMATAKESKMNFMVGHLDKLFAGLVGSTEKNTRKLLEAVDSAAPVIVFLDELDSVLSSGRSSTGDSGTSARVFHSIMTWLGDDSRAGRVVVIGATNRPDLLDDALIRSGRFDAKLPALPPQKGDALGRKQILEALCRKHGTKFAKEVAETEREADSGIGRLLTDAERIWTGAEIEVVLKEALDNASFAKRTKANGQPDLSIRLVDWDQAMDDILPNTRAVERMTKLALLYTDHLGYCPKEWREIARNKEALSDELGLSRMGSDDN